MSASMSAALKCEVLPCVSLITWMWFVASAGLICPSTISGTSRDCSRKRQARFAREFGRKASLIALRKIRT